MKLLKAFLSAFLLYILFFAGGTQFSACKKTVTEHDTTVVVKHDTTTVIKKDTVILKDSIYDLKSGLVAYYNFIGGTLKDSSGMGNNITLNSTATLTADRFGKANNAYYFNGSSFMSVPNSASLNPTSAITIAVVIQIGDYYLGNCGANEVLGKGYNDFIDGFYYLRFGSTSGCGNPVDTSKELFSAGYGNLNNRTGLGDNNYIQRNKWYNVVYTFESGVATLYVNGITKSRSYETLTSTGNSLDLTIGKHGDPSNPYWFTGTIDDIRIYNRALPRGAVVQLYNLKE